MPGDSKQEETQNPNELLLKEFTEKYKLEVLALIFVIQALLYAKGLKVIGIIEHCIESFFASNIEDKKFKDKTFIALFKQAIELGIEKDFKENKVKEQLITLIEASAYGYNEQSVTEIIEYLFKIMKRIEDGENSNYYVVTKQDIDDLKKITRPLSPKEIYLLEDIIAGRPLPENKQKHKRELFIEDMLLPKKANKISQKSIDKYAKNSAWTDLITEVYEKNYLKWKKIKDFLKKNNETKAENKGITYLYLSLFLLITAMLWVYAMAPDVAILIEATARNFGLPRFVVAILFAGTVFSLPIFFALIDRNKMNVYHAALEQENEKLNETYGEVLANQKDLRDLLENKLTLQVVNVHIVSDLKSTEPNPNKTTSFIQLSFEPTSNSVNIKHENEEIKDDIKIERKEKRKKTKAFGFEPPSPDIFSADKFSEDNLSPPIEKNVCDTSEFIPNRYVFFNTPNNKTPMKINLKKGNLNALDERSRTKFFQNIQEGTLDIRYTGKRNLCPYKIIIGGENTRIYLEEKGDEYIPHIGKHIKG